MVSRADPTTTPWAVRVALALIAGCTTAGALYAILRVAQSITSPDADPALVIWSEHSGYYWRCWTAAYMGSMIGFFAYVAATRNAERIARLVAWSLPLAFVVILAQGLLVP